MIEHIRHWLEADSFGIVVSAVFVFVASLVGGWILKKFLGTTGRRLTARTDTELDDKILEILLPRIKWLAFVIGGYLASEEVGKALRVHQTTALQFLGYARGFIFVAFVWVVTAAILKIVTTVLSHMMEEHARKSGAAFNDNLLPLINRVSSIVIFSFAVITVLGQFGVNINSLLVFLGGGSVAIALAAQDTLSNMIAGFVIIIDQPFRVGDRVKLPSGEVGDIQEIGLRTTQILDSDNNMIISPNGELVKAKVINFSYPHQEIKVAVEVGVAYGTNIDSARRVMMEIASRHPEVLETPKPEVFVTALADSSVTILLVARTHDFKKRFPVETSLREQIYTTFQREGIQIPFPQRVVHLSQHNG